MSGGGSSKSTSATTTTTSNADNRGVADNGSQIVSGSSNVTLTDLGAVTKALQFASDSGNAVINANTVDFGKLLDVGVAILGQGQKNIDTTANTLAAAYTDAKGGTTQDRYIAMLGIGAVVAVAFAFTRKH